MSPLVEALLEAFGAEEADPERAAQVGLGPFLEPRLARQVRLSNAVLRMALEAIGEAFGEEVPFLLLKGEPLEELLYGGEYWRGTGDVDLLVLPGDLEEARRRLKGLGYEPVDPEGPRMWSHNQEAFRHREVGVVVEVHWSIAEPRIAQPPVGALFWRAESFVFRDGLEVKVLGSADLLLHMALHFHHHMGFARGLMDLAGWSDQFGEGEALEEALERAEELGIRGLLQWPARTIEKLTGERPVFWEEGADPMVRAWAAASATAMRGCLRRRPRGDLEATLVYVMPEVGAAQAVLLQALSMLVVDGAGAKWEAMWAPILRGPHRVGRWMEGGSSKSFGADWAG